MNRNKLVALSLVSSLCIAIAGCAPDNSGGTPPPPRNLSFPLSPNGQPSNPNVSTVPDQVRAAMMGNYGGRLFRRDWSGNKVVQDYSLSVQQYSQQGGGAYAYAVLNSDGPLGNIHLEGYLAVGLNNYFGTYSLASQAMTDSDWNDVPVAIQLLFNFSTVPAQSSISILECGFYQGAGCGVSTDQVGFEPGTFVKR